MRDVAYVDELNGRIGRRGRQHRAAAREANRPIGEAIGRVVGAHDQTGANDRRSREFVVRLVQRDAPGDYNVTSPQGLCTMGDVLSACAAASRVGSTVTWVDEEYLLEQGVAPWVDLPLWIPPGINASGILNMNVGKALVAGLEIRRLTDTVRDTLAWAATLPRDYVPRAGLTPDRERSLLSAFKKRSVRLRISNRGVGV